jgi:hypothetical protein
MSRQAVACSKFMQRQPGEADRRRKVQAGTGRQRQVSREAEEGWQAGAGRQGLLQARSGAFRKALAGTGRQKGRGRQAEAGRRLQGGQACQTGKSRETGRQRQVVKGRGRQGQRQAESSKSKGNQAGAGTGKTNG